jgi:hypothetical protein
VSELEEVGAGKRPLLAGYVDCGSRFRRGRPSSSSTHIGVAAEQSLPRGTFAGPRPFRKSAQFAFIATAAGDEFWPYRR